MNDRRPQIIVAMRRAGHVRMFMVVLMIGFSIVLMTVPVSMPVSVCMSIGAAAEQEHAGDIDDQAEPGDGDRLVEADRNGPDKPRKRLVTDEERDHGKYDGAGETGEIAELAGAEAEAVVGGVAARVAIGQRGEEQGARMRGHMQ